MATATATTRFCHLDSPIGRLLLLGDGEALTGLYLADFDHAPDPPRDARRDDDAFSDVASQLGEYFAGTRRTFDVDLHLEGTPFQLEVWAALSEVSYGEVASYGEIARRVGRPNAYRAVGSANGSNRISVIVPCHRIVASGGGLGGYGWGMTTKTWLLDLERGTG